MAVMLERLETLAGEEKVTDFNHQPGRESAADIVPLNKAFLNFFLQTSVGIKGIK